MKNILTTLCLYCTFLIASAPMRSNTVLFCLEPEVKELTIIDENSRTDNIEINNLLQEYSVQKIEPWLPNARPSERDGDIYLTKIYRVFTQDNINIDELKIDLEALADIHSSEYEFIRKPVYTPNDSQYGQQWFLPQINANSAWDFWDISPNNSPGSKDVLLASVDTGVDWDHPDLRGNIWNNLGEDADGDGQTIIQSGGSWIFDPGDVNLIDDDGNGYIDDFIGWDCSGFSGGEDNDPMPPSGVSNGGTWAHGTHVAGLLSAHTDNNTGIASAAFNCSIMCVKVSTGEQGYPYITHGYNGILYAAQAGYDINNYAIINNSWGGLGYSLYEQATINIAHNDYGAIVLAAGGNGDDSGLGTNEFAHYPSSYDNVVAVCPTGTGDSWNNWATYHHTIDLASPGEGIRSTRIGNGYTNWSGSSMATPIVGSVMGLVKSYNPSWTNEQIETMVIQTADPIIYTVNPSESLEGKLGKGRVDALAAIATPLFPKIEFVDIDLFIESDDNNVLEIGENIELFTILSNNPDWGYADDVIATLELDEEHQDEHIMITQNMSMYGSAAPGDGLINWEPFIVEFGDSVNPGDIKFKLNIVSNTDFNQYIQNEQILEFIIPISDQVFIPGDVNQDAIINILDIVQIVNIILDTNPPNVNLNAADLNNDDVINVLDIILIVNIILDA